MTSTNKVLIVHWQQGTGGGQELRVEDNLKEKQKKKLSLISWFPYMDFIQHHVKNPNRNSVIYLDTVIPRVEEADASDVGQDGIC